MSSEAFAAWKGATTIRFYWLGTFLIKIVLVNKLINSYAIQWNKIKVKFKYGLDKRPRLTLKVTKVWQQSVRTLHVIKQTICAFQLHVRIGHTVQLHVLSLSLSAYSWVQWMHFIGRSSQVSRDPLDGLVCLLKSNLVNPCKLQEIPEELKWQITGNFSFITDDMDLFLDNAF